MLQSWICRGNEVLDIPSSTLPAQPPVMLVKQQVVDNKLQDHQWLAKETRQRSWRAGLAPGCSAGAALPAPGCRAEPGWFATGRACAPHCWQWCGGCGVAGVPQAGFGKDLAHFQWPSGGWWQECDAGGTRSCTTAVNCVAGNRVVKEIRFITQMLLRVLSSHCLSRCLASLLC